MTKSQPERLELTLVRPGMTVEEVSKSLIAALERAGIKVHRNRNGHSSERSWMAKRSGLKPPSTSHLD